jgi:hypothetical protein
VEDNDIQKLLRVISPYFRSPQMQTPVVPFSTGFQANMQQYRPGWGETIADFVFPGREKPVPPTWAVSDFRQMMQTQKYHESIQAQMTSRSGMASAAARVMLTQLTGDKKQAGKIVSAIDKSPYGSMLFHSAYKMAFGTGIEGQRAGAAINMSRFFSGYAFDRPPGAARPTYGLGRQELTRMTKGLYSAAYEDDLGMFRKKPAFGMRDVSEIAMLGVKYGGEAKNVNQVINQTKSMMSMVQTGMAIYQTMDKEGVLQSIMELTRGQIPITSTVQSEAILRKVHSWAKVTNTNMKLMHRLSAETSQLFEEAGLSAPAGATFGASTVGFVKGITKGRGAIFSQREVAQLGFQSGIRQQVLKTSMGFMMSSGFANQAMLYQHAGAALGPEATQKDIATYQQDIISKIRRGEGPDMDQVRRVEKAMQKRLQTGLAASGMTEAQAEQTSSEILSGRVTAARGEATGKLLAAMREKYGDFEVSRTAARASVSEVFKKVHGRDASQLLERAGTGDKKARSAIVAALTTRYASDMGPHAAYKKALVDARLAAMTPQQVTAAKERRTEAIQAEITTEALEKTRTAGSSWDIVKRGFITNFKDVSIGEAAASLIPKFSFRTASGYPGFLPRAVSGRGMWSKSGPLNKAYLQSYKEHVKGLSPNKIMAQHMNWFQDPRLRSQYAFFESALGHNMFTRKGMFGEGGFYQQMQTALGELGTVGFGEQLKRLGKEGITTTAEDIYGAMEGTQFTFGDYAGYLRSQGGNYSKMSLTAMASDPTAVSSYVSFMDNLKGIKGAEGLDAGEKLIAAAKRFTRFQEKTLGGQYTAVIPEEIYSEEEMEKRIQQARKGLGMEKESNATASTRLAQRFKQTEAFIEKEIKSETAKGKFRFDIAVNALEHNKSPLLSAAARSWQKVNYGKAPGEVAALAKQLGFGKDTSKLKSYFGSVAGAMGEADKGDLVKALFRVTDEALPRRADVSARMTQVLKAAQAYEYTQATQGKTFRSPFTKLIKEASDRPMAATGKAALSETALANIKQTEIALKAYTEGSQANTESTKALIASMKAQVAAIGKLLIALGVDPARAKVRAKKEAGT